MKEFVLAALPWVLAGLAVAIICAGMNREKADKTEKDTEHHIALGASLGLLWGVALNNCGLWDNQALGLALGPLWGMALATLWDDRNKTVVKEKKVEKHSIRKMKKRRMAMIVASVILACLLVFFAGAWSMFGEIIKAAKTVEKQEMGLYSMEYAGDYGFDEFLARGGAASDVEVADYLTEFLSHGFYKVETSVSSGEYGCSTICTTDENGDVLFGRNYDWEKCSAIIVNTKPKNGYESVSTCCLDFLGFGEDYTADGSMINRMMTLAAIYVPLDGMNEKGLMIADLMAGDQEETHQNTEKTDLTTTTAIRLLLDRAANVDEAIALLKQYDMNSSIGSAHHFSIADASGKSVVVEYIDGEMLVTDTKIVTNHYLTKGEKYGVGSKQSHERFDTLAQYSGSTDQEGVKNMLKSVAQFNYPQSADSYEKTMWSVVYTPSAMMAEFYFDENYEYSYFLSLSDKGGWIMSTK